MPQTLERLTPQQVVEAYEAHKARERTRGSMATSNWPTVLAHPCEAYGVFNRTVPPQNRRKIGADLAMIFSEGNDQARIVKRDLEAAGFEVSGEEEQMTWPKFQISGRRDLVLWKEGMREKVRVEVKSCAPYTYDKINSADDLAKSDKMWLRKWARQVALYMILQGVDRYWLLLKNKSNGQIKIIEFVQNDELLDCAEAMLAKAERINHLVQIGMAPPDTTKISDPDLCNECEFFDTCLPQLQLGPGAVVLTEEDAAELALMLRRRAELDAAASEYDQIDKEVKAAIKAAASEGQDKVVIEDWIASIKTIEKKAFTIPAHSEKRITFIRSDK